MTRNPVESSCIVSAGYSAESLVLEVEFVKGRIYEYFEVPSVIYVALIDAESKGQFINQHIIGRFRYRSLGAGAR